EREVRESRRAGFSGKLAIHPAQVDEINSGYAPDAEELRHAQAVIDAFAVAAGAGAVQLDGKMLDKPHLVQAQRILGLAASARSSRPAGCPCFEISASRSFASSAMTRRFPSCARRRLPTQRSPTPGLISHSPTRPSENGRMRQRRWRKCSPSCRSKSRCG